MRRPNTDFLTLAELGAYTRLRPRLNGHPITPEEAMRVARAVTQKEKAAVRAVLPFLQLRETTPPAGVSLHVETMTWTGLTEKDALAWQEMFPAISVPDQMARAASWCVANLTNGKGRKSNYRRFLHNWLSRAQDRGRPIK